MAAPYDYVQIVTDDDWGLVGIIPNNGTKTPKGSQLASLNSVKTNGNPFVSINKDDKIKGITSSSNQSVYETKSQERSHRDPYVQVDETKVRLPIERKTPAETQTIFQAGSFRTLPEATVVNRRRPITKPLHGSGHSIASFEVTGQNKVLFDNTHIMEKKVDDPPITRAELTNANISLYGRTVNPNTLNGIGALEYSQINDNRIVSVRGGSQHRIEASDPVLFGEISNLAGAGNRDNILVGFGR